MKAAGWAARIAPCDARNVPKPVATRELSLSAESMAQHSLATVAMAAA